MREKEQSNLTAPSPRRLTLPKSRILRGRTNFKSFFTNSKSLSSTTVFLRYRIEKAQSSEFKIAFIAPKKIGSAVKRNKSKRLMREAYRLNQQIVDSLLETPLSIHVALIARSSGHDFKTVQDEVVTLLHNLRTRVTEHPLLKN